ncbi:DUF2268 domain-containing protein [Terribacillus saccharophilus]|uniref:Zn-dependent protease n=1 Tax=Terribacillus saccharophilus TaxID=361277 RepID=A0ABX4GUP0_9BACI|nr:DUF2268 domain-containing protein [Terribacillus saccharophilus]PAD34248.1 Zn-dependent protease [Terribacillus saccharophilus]PAD94834.1 Zn-dependent protease [Terribacillus saccharophilus]PAD98583.1 Zn-dependent protease [Terribacillus saccharophilus]
MSVIRTDEWLLDDYDDPIALCEKLTELFTDASAAEIYDYFIRHGMYRPLKKNKQLDAKVWEVVQQDEAFLQKEWEGPDIPIYIFPSDERNKWIQKQLGGKSGLAFKDKLFLFISTENTEEEIKAIFTHEYNHVCRLNRLDKKEEMYTLLDTIVLEGIAENAVRERLGEELTASWTSFYSDKKIEKMWSENIVPKQQLLRQDYEYEAILFGYRKYPKMLGYCAGYHVVKNYMERHSLSSKELLAVDASVITGDMESGEHE